MASVLVRGDERGKSNWQSISGKVCVGEAMLTEKWERRVK